MNKKKLFKRICLYLLALVLLIHCNVPVAYADETVTESESESVVENDAVIESESESKPLVITGFEQTEILITGVIKGSYEELSEKFPNTLNVTLSDGTTCDIEVGWYSDVDYETTEESKYQFFAILPEGYVLADGVDLPYVGVVMDDEYITSPFVHFDENLGGMTIDQYIGATGIVEHLNSHRYDGFYIGTPYAGWSSGTANWVCMTPNGALYNGWYSGMNCTGFVQYVLQACGGDWTKINLQGNCNLSAWTYAMAYNNLDSAITVWKFNSKEEMLASGKLQKGDIIMMEPTYMGSWSGATDAYGNYIDCHIGFYWGDSTNQDIFWHSSHATYGLGWSIIEGPSNGSGNQISNIVPKCQGNVFYVFPIKHTGHIQISKTFSGGNSSYNPDTDPAHYTIYSDAACTTPAETLVGASTFRIESNFKSGEIPVKAGTYYVKETRSPSGWDKDTNVYKVVVTQEHTIASPAIVSSTNTKKITQGYLKLVKSSSNTDMTAGNSNYSLSGAVYGVYSNSACTTKVTELKTGTNGQTSAVKLNAGTYYVKEISAPQGFYKSESVYTVKISTSHTSSSPYTLKVSDVPYNDPMAIKINKVDAITGETVTQGAASLAGTQFTIRYYDGFYTKDNLPSASDAKRSWVIEVKERTTSLGETVYYTRLDEEYKVSGDAFYYQDGVVTLPLGTISIEETKAAAGYTLENGYLQKVSGGDKIYGVYVAQIKETNGLISLQGGNEFQVANYPVPRTLTLTKTIHAGDINLANGNPTFIFKVSGTDTAGKAHTYYRLVEFTPEYIAGKTGDISISVTLDDLIAGTYTASEEIVARYELRDITNINGGRLSGETVVFDLISNTSGSAVFYNTVYEHGWFSGNDSVINHVQKR